MAYKVGIMRYRKYKWLAELMTLIQAGSLKMAILNGQPAVANADYVDPTPEGTLTYGDIMVAGVELSSSGTGYTTGGYVLDEASVGVNGSPGSGFVLGFSAVGSAVGVVETGVGTIPAGNYTGVIYNNADSRKVVEAIIPLTVSQGSQNGIVRFTIPNNVIEIA